MPDVRSLEAVVQEAPGNIFGPSCFGPHTHRPLPRGSAGSVFIHWPKSGRQLAFCPGCLNFWSPRGAAGSVLRAPSPPAAPAVESS